jgi:sortase (surface protein transpeptidase)
MDTPKNPDSAAWFDLGPRPGEIGNAVIDGHYGVYKNGKVSVFNNLHTLKMGNHILVKDDAGNHITFIVRKLRIYSRHEHPPEVFLSNDGLSHLNIITCQGIWDRKAKNYPNRLVVFADKVM